MGARGTYDWAMANPEHFAAIAPSSMSGSIFRASRLTNIAVWIFHGEKDRFPVHMAEAMFTALQDCGANTKLTVFPDAGHNLSGVMNYEELEDWFLQHKRSQEPVPADPLNELQFDHQGIAEKETITLSSQRFARLLTNQGRMSAAFPLYDVYRNAGLRARGHVQLRSLPSHPNDLLEYMLAVPMHVNIDDLPESVEFIQTDACRAVSFILRSKDYSITGDSTEENVPIDNILKELETKDEIPTGEIRKTYLEFDRITQQYIYKFLIILKG